jgi:hypothetical protein
MTGQDRPGAALIGRLMMADRLQCNPAAIMAGLVIWAVVLGSTMFPGQAAHVARIAAALVMCAAAVAVLGVAVTTLGRVTPGRDDPPGPVPAEVSAPVLAPDEAAAITGVIAELADTRTVLRFTADGTALEVTKDHRS